MGSPDRGPEGAITLPRERDVQERRVEELQGSSPRSGAACSQSCSGTFFLVLVAAGAGMMNATFPVWLAGLRVVTQSAHGHGDHLV